MPSPLGPSASDPWSSDVLESEKYNLVLEKSNILMLGPTGSGLYAILSYAILFYTVLYYSILCYTVLYCAILFYTVLYCAILFYTVL